jgi:NAD-dependent dihydropyrimidine dehydrogenase PreA subunit
MRENVYQRLAKHLSSLGMGYPEKEELLEILRENFTPLEAEVALAIPTKVIPFEPVPVGEIVPPSHPSEEAGLVHLVDNAREGIKHTCNCCGCCCWSVGTIRRKKIPRDMLMATYFLRETDQERCTGCGRCVDICPVQVIRMEGDFPVIDQEWCIGCGVCAIPCPGSAVKLARKSHALPPRDFRELHEQILKERKTAGRDSSSLRSSE